MSGMVSHPVEAGAAVGRPSRASNCLSQYRRPQHLHGLIVARGDRGHHGLEDASGRTAADGLTSSLL